MLPFMPVVLLNLVTQFLTDDDNARMLQTHRCVYAALRIIPRSSSFIVKSGSKNIYGRYNNIVMLKRNIYGAFQTNKLCNFMNDIPSNDVHEMQIDVDWNLLPSYKNVTKLLLSNKTTTNFLNYFPNIRELVLYVYVLKDSYPDLPCLKVLRVIGGVPWTWPTVHTLTAEGDIPPGYTALRHVTLSDITCIPPNLVEQIETITWKLPVYVRIGVDVHLDLLPFTSLREIRFDEVMMSAMVIVKCHKSVLVIGDVIVLH